MGGNGEVDGGHETGRCSQDATEAAVVVNVCKEKTTPHTLLQPLLGRAVAADGEGPGFRSYAVEVLFGIDPYLAGMVVLWRPIGWFLNAIITVVRKFRCILIIFCLKAMVSHQLLAQVNEGCKKSLAADDRQAGEVRFQMVPVALAIGRAME